jgi:hypothetical protein
VWGAGLRDIISRMIGPNPAEVCPERLALGQAMVEAAALVYKAKREYDDARVRASKPALQGELLLLLDALTQARARALEASQAFEEHVALHHCAG